MSNWRDRNERDAIPPTLAIVSKSNEIAPYHQKNNKNSNITKAKIVITISLFVSLTSLFMIAGIFYGNLYLNGKSYVEPSGINPPPSSKRSELIGATCEMNSQENLATWLTYSSGKKRLFITWNSSDLSTTYYRLYERCQKIVAKLDKYINSESKKYTFISYENSDNIDRLCAIENGDEYCNSQNILIDIKPSETQAIKSFDIRCRITLPNQTIKKTNPFGDTRRICLFPLGD